MTARITQLQDEIKTLSTLLNTAPSISSRFTTPRKLKADNIPYNPPGLLPNPCQHCGKMLEPYGFYVEFLQRYTWIGHEKCGCKESTEANTLLLAQRKKEMESLLCQQEQEKIEKLFKVSGLGKRFMGRTFDTFVVDADNQDAFTLATKYCNTFDKHKEKGTGLYFQGSCGTGKTYIAAAIAHRLMRERIVTLLFITSIDLLNHIKQTYQGDNQCKEIAVMDIYKKCGLLIIDDLGKERMSEWALSIFSNIINSRYEAQLPIIITTNYTDDVLIRRMTTADGDKLTVESILSRLHEMTYAVSMQGRDRRFI